MGVQKGDEALVSCVRKTQQILLDNIQVSFA
jgi:hypothetical protein